METKGTKSNTVYNRANRRSLIKTFYYKNYAWLITAIIFLLINSVLEVAVAYLLQGMLDQAIDGSVRRLLSLAIQSLVFMAAIIGSWLIVRSCKNRFIRNAMRNYKEAIFEKITNKSISSFMGEKTGRYISALTNDATAIEQNYLTAIFKFVTNIVWFIAALALMLWYDWSMTLLAIGLSLLPMTISIAFGGRLIKEERAISEKNESFVGMIKDLLTGFTVIKSFKAEKEIKNLFNENNKNLEESKNKRRLTTEMIQLISSIASFAVQIGIFFYGTYLAITGDSVTVGIVIAFVQLMNFVLMPIRELPTLFANRKAAIALIEKVASAVEVSAGRDGKLIENVLKDCIQIKDLYFGYEPENYILRNINLKFEKGKSYAVVGGSGSGKTTLLNLIMGNFDNYEGEITFDGDELRDISSDSLFDMLSVVQQNVFIFDNSIIDNITLFKDFSSNDIDNAVGRAGLANLLSERGYDYRCGENGIGLSGGERQRISIARSLLRDTPVLLMDESTAALDTVTAHAITNSVLDIEGLTRIIVTHKLEEVLLKKFDEIIVIRNGIVFECGTFEVLMDRREYFYSLYMVSQSE